MMMLFLLTLMTSSQISSCSCPSTCCRYRHYLCVHRTDRTLTWLSDQPSIRLLIIHNNVLKTANQVDCHHLQYQDLYMFIYVCEGGRGSCLRHHHHHLIPDSLCFHRKHQMRKNDLTHKQKASRSSFFLFLFLFFLYCPSFSCFSFSRSGLSDWFAWPLWKPNRWSCNLINEPGPFVILVALQSATRAASVCQLAPRCGGNNTACEWLRLNWCLKHTVRDQLGQFWVSNVGSRGPLEGP